MRKYNFADGLGLPGFRTIVLFVVGLISLSVAIDLVGSIPWGFLFGFLPDWLIPDIAKPFAEHPSECTTLPDGARICPDGFWITDLTGDK